MIHPQDIVISREITKTVNAFQGILEEVDEKISYVRLKIRVGEAVLTSELPLDVYGLLNLKLGEKVFINIRPRAVKLIQYLEEEVSDILWIILKNLGRSGGIEL